MFRNQVLSLSWSKCDVKIKTALRFCLWTSTVELKQPMLSIMKFSGGKGINNYMIQKIIR